MGTRVRLWEEKQNDASYEVCHDGNTSQQFWSTDYAAEHLQFDHMQSRWFITFTFTKGLNGKKNECFPEDGVLKRTSELKIISVDEKN